MTAVTLVPDPPCVLGGGKTCGVTTVVLFYSVVLVPVPVTRLVVAGLLVGNHIVDACSLVLFVPAPLGCKRF